MTALPRLVAFWLAALTAVAAMRVAAAEPLPALGADAGRVSVSGLSSGAYMAGQFQVAYSGSVTGAGIVAGGPYGCARSPSGEMTPFWGVALSLNLTRAQNRCMEDGWLFSTVPAAGFLAGYASRLAEAGKIDPLSGLAADRVYLFSSRQDDTVERGVVEGAYAFYKKAGVPAANIDFVKRNDAAHAFLTEAEGLACGEEGPPFINRCGYDQAKAILEWLHGPLGAPAEPIADAFIAFEQTPFLAVPGEAGFSAQGFAYIPPPCRTAEACAVHVVFHGCKQGYAAIGDVFIKRTGYARWAQANQIVLLFPQVEASELNPNGCWDWWGYTGPDFLERGAPQMAAVKRMLDRVTSPRP
jgi:poly(3-hydroxybutyrate) depolymerase